MQTENHVHEQLVALRKAFRALRKRYVVLLILVGFFFCIGQYFIQTKLQQIGITYEALNDIQQLYEVGSLLQPKGLMIVATTKAEEKQQHIFEFSNNIEIYLKLYKRLRNNSEYHQVFAVSDTVKNRIFRLDDASKTISKQLPIFADSISIDTTFNRIAVILSVHAKAEQELNIFIMGYRQELQQMRLYLQWMSLGLIIIFVVAIGGETIFILLPSKSTTERLFLQTELFQQDLTTALKKVSETHSRYELLVNAAHDCVYQLDTRGRFVFANKAAVELLGYDSAMLAETYYLDYVHPDYRRTVMVEYQRQNNNNDEYSTSMTFPVVDSSGKTRWIEQSFTKLFENQMFIGFLGIARDITEKREIQRTFDELAMLNSLVLENTASAVLTTDMNGTITLFNRAAEYLLGFEESEVNNKVEILTLFSEESLRQMKKALVETFDIETTSELDILFLHAENFGNFLQRSLFVTKHNNSVPVEMRLRLLKDSSQKTKGLLLTAVDVTETQHLEQIKQEFISRVSHEMRTPLHGIMGMIEILRASELNDEQKSLLEIAQSKSDVLLTLINDILDYSKIQSGTLEIQRVNSDVSILISNISEVLQHRLFSKNTELEINLSADIPEIIYCDPVRLYQIILSLSDNLMQFIQGGTLHIDFDYVNKQEGNSGLYISLYFQNGLVNADIQRKVFTPFVDENDNKERFHPAGLQISLMRGIVQQIGGVLWLENNLETGSTFHIFLSLDKTINTAEVDKNFHHQASNRNSLGFDKNIQPEFSQNSTSFFSQSQSQHLATLGITTKQITILVVDDDEDNRRLAQTFLSNTQSPHYSINILLAENGREAFEIFTSQSIDIVLMDIQMPEMDGFEATKKIREFERSEQRTRTPIIAVTAHVMENYREKCLQVGMSDYLAKPVKKHQLQDMVSQWLEQRKVVLIVDDSEDFRLITKLQLEKEQRYNILEASNGREAIDLFQEHTVDAIVMDMEMPVLNGYDATKIIRQMPKGRKTPIYAMTGHNGEKEIQKTIEVGCTQCFSKTGLETIRIVIKQINLHFESEKIREIS